MNSTNYAYWLMGYFEIGDNQPQILKSNQVLCIQKHLDMVFTYDKKPSKFCVWLKGFIDGIYVSNDISDLNENTVAVIKKELHDIFKHEIDLTYGNSSMQDKLNEIHNNNQTPHQSLPHNSLPHNDGAILRC